MNASRRQVDDHRRFYPRPARRLCALIDPQLDEGQLLRGERLLRFGGHKRLVCLAGEMDKWALGRLAGDDRRPALPASHQVLVGTQVKLRLLDGPAVAEGTLVDQDRL